MQDLTPTQEKAKALTGVPFTAAQIMPMGFVHNGNCFRDYKAPHALRATQPRGKTSRWTIHETEEGVPFRKTKRVPLFKGHRA